MIKRPGLGGNQTEFMHPYMSRVFAFKCVAMKLPKQVYDAARNATVYGVGACTL